MLASLSRFGRANLTRQVSKLRPSCMHNTEVCRVFTLKGIYLGSGCVQCSPRLASTATSKSLASPAAKDNFGYHVRILMLGRLLLLTFTCSSKLNNGCQVRQSSSIYCYCTLRTFHSSSTRIYFQHNAIRRQDRRSLAFISTYIGI